MHELYLQKYEPEEFAKLQQGETANPVVKYDYWTTSFEPLWAKLSGQQYIALVLFPQSWIPNA